MNNFNWFQLLIFGLPVLIGILNWSSRKVQEKAAQRQREAIKRQTELDQLRTGRGEGNPEPDPTPAAQKWETASRPASQAPTPSQRVPTAQSSRLEEIAERRRAQLEELRRRRQQKAGAARAPTDAEGDDSGEAPSRDPISILLPGSSSGTTVPSRPARRQTGRPSPGTPSRTGASGRGAGATAGPVPPVRQAPTRPIPSSQSPSPVMPASTTRVNRPDRRSQSIQDMLERQRLVDEARVIHKRSHPVLGPINRASLRRAILWQEVLGAPVALRRTR